MTSSEQMAQVSNIKAVAGSDIIRTNATGEKCKNCFTIVRYRI